MNRYDCLKALVPHIKDQLVVPSVSGQWVWGELCPRDGNLLLGSMGNALGVGLGMALGLPHRKVIVIESDGSVLLSLFNLPTLGNLNPPNLVVFVFDNEMYSGSRISRPSATAGKTDLAAMARDAGIASAITVRDLDAFRHEALRAINENGLSFIVAKVTESFEHRQAPRSDMDLTENKYRFIRYIEKTEGIGIFAGRG
ncbi:MAG TPA: thiamine pyrophosphate-dependent enzyme [Candidatus Eisenbacteria bacterium]|nr:thiamine pyrophosphate-dependent enzyme [Candidatus Eisenbacteria bacterium]